MLPGSSDQPFPVCPQRVHHYRLQHSPRQPRSTISNHPRSIVSKCISKCTSKCTCAPVSKCTLLQEHSGLSTVFSQLPFPYALKDSEYHIAVYAIQLSVYMKQNPLRIIGAKEDRLRLERRCESCERRQKETACEWRDCKGLRKEIHAAKAMESWKVHGKGCKRFGKGKSGKPES